MKKIPKRYLDIFKERTLRCLSTKKESQNNYPIKKSDLIYIKQCPLCKQRWFIPVASVNLNKNLTFIITSACKNCLLVFRATSPNLKWFKKCWKKIKNNSLEVFNPEVEKIRKKRYEKYHRLLSRYVKSGDVLDIGAGYGMGSSVFKDHGYNVEALEPEDNKVRYIKKVAKIPAHQKSIESFLSSSDKRRYDLIVMAHCLEHLDNPMSVLKKLKKLLKPSGFLYIEVPLIWSYVTWTDALYLTHKSNFSKENLIYFAKKSGFKIRGVFNSRHNKRENLDLGLVLQNSGRGPATDQIIFNKGKHTIKDILKLYHKNLPIKNLHAIKTKELVYTVPRIEQFYCTLKLENYTLIDNYGSLIFKPK